MEDTDEFADAYEDESAMKTIPSSSISTSISTSKSLPFSSTDEEDSAALAASVNSATHKSVVDDVVEHERDTAPVTVPASGDDDHAHDHNHDLTDTDHEHTDTEHTDTDTDHDHTDAENDTGDTDNSFDSQSINPINITSSRTSSKSTSSKSASNNSHHASSSSSSGQSASSLLSTFKSGATLKVANDSIAGLVDLNKDVDWGREDEECRERNGLSGEDDDENKVTKSTSASETNDEELEAKKYQVKNQETGETYDLRSLNTQLPPQHTNYTLIPNLEQIQSARYKGERGGSFDDDDSTRDGKSSAGNSDGTGSRPSSTSTSTTKSGSTSSSTGTKKSSTMGGMFKSFKKGVKAVSTKTFEFTHKEGNNRSSIDSEAFRNSTSTSSNRGGAGNNSENPNHVTSKSQKKDNLEFSDLVLLQTFYSPNVMVPLVSNHRSGTSSSSPSSSNLNSTNPSNPPSQTPMNVMNSPTQSHKSSSNNPSTNTPNLSYSKSPIWVMKFSPCGKYFATGGADKAVNVWEVARPRSSSSSSNSSTNTNTNYNTRDSNAGGGANTEFKKSKDKDGYKNVTSPLTQPDVSELPSHLPHPPTNANKNTSANNAPLKTNISQSHPPPKHPLPNATSPLSLFTSSLPLRSYRSHTADVIDLSWSKTTFLLSASIDKTVRLWHVSRKECLHLFQHSDFVTSVHFHPLEDRFFLSGGFDKKLRIWSIPDGRVKEWASCPEMVTSARFTPTGLMVVAGLYHGQVYFYSTDGMRYYTQIECRNRHGSFRGGKKVTGLGFLKGGSHSHGGNGGKRDMANTSGSESDSGGSRYDSRDGGSSSVDSYGSRSSNNNSNDGSNTNSNNGNIGRLSSRTSRNSSSSSSSASLGRRSSSTSESGSNSNSGSSLSDRRSQMFSEQLLVTTNDSRLRLFGLDDYSCLRKYKGSVNFSMQIRASFSDSGHFIISGSEDGRVYIWNTVTPVSESKGFLGGFLKSSNSSNGNGKGGGNDGDSERSNYGLPSGGGAAGGSSGGNAERNKSWEAFDACTFHGHAYDDRDAYHEHNSEYTNNANNGSSNNGSGGSGDNKQPAPNIITDALFVPARALKMSLLASGIVKNSQAFDASSNSNTNNNNTNNANMDLTAAMIISSDYTGRIRVFLKKSYFDNLVARDKALSEDAARDHRSHEDYMTNMNTSTANYIDFNGGGSGNNSASTSANSSANNSNSSSNNSNNSNSNHDSNSSGGSAVGGIGVGSGSGGGGVSGGGLSGGGGSSPFKSAKDNNNNKGGLGGGDFGSVGGGMGFGGETEL